MMQYSRFKPNERAGIDDPSDNGKDFDVTTLPPVVLGNGEYARAHWPSLNAWMTPHNFLLVVCCVVFYGTLALMLAFGPIFAFGVGAGLAMSLCVSATRILTK